MASNEANNASDNCDVNDVISSHCSSRDAACNRLEVHDDALNKDDVSKAADGHVSIKDDISKTTDGTVSIKDDISKTVDHVSIKDDIFQTVDGHVAIKDDITKFKESSEASKNGNVDENNDSNDNEDEASATRNELICRAKNYTDFCKRSFDRSDSFGPDRDTDSEENSQDFLYRDNYFDDRDLEYEYEPGISLSSLQFSQILSDNDDASPHCSGCRCSQAPPPSGHCAGCSCLQESDLQLAAELGKTLLERNRELENSLKHHQAVIEDQGQEIEYLTKQSGDLKDLNDQRLRVYEQIEISLQEAEASNKKLTEESFADKAKIKSLTSIIESLEQRCDDLQGLVQETRRQFVSNESKRRKERRKKTRETSDQKLQGATCHNQLASTSEGEEEPEGEDGGDCGVVPNPAAVVPNKPRPPLAGGERMPPSSSASSGSGEPRDSGYYSGRILTDSDISHSSQEESGQDSLQLDMEELRQEVIKLNSANKRVQQENSELQTQVGSLRTENSVLASRLEAALSDGGPTSVLSEVCQASRCKNCESLSKTLSGQSDSSPGVHNKDDPTVSKSEDVSPDEVDGQPEENCQNNTHADSVIADTLKKFESKAEASCIKCQTSAKPSFVLSLESEGPNYCSQIGALPNEVLLYHEWSEDDNFDCLDYCVSSSLSDLSLSRYCLSVHTSLSFDDQHTSGSVSLPTHWEAVDDESRGQDLLTNESSNMSSLLATRSELATGMSGKGLRPGNQLHNVESPASYLDEQEDALSSSEEDNFDANTVASQMSNFAKDSKSERKPPQTKNCPESEKETGDAEDIDLIAGRDAPTDEVVPISDSAPNRHIEQVDKDEAVHTPDHDEDDEPEADAKKAVRHESPRSDTQGTVKGDEDNEAGSRTTTADLAEGLEAMGWSRVSSISCHVGTSLRDELRTNNNVFEPEDRETVSESDTYSSGFSDGLSEEKFCHKETQTEPKPKSRKKNHSQTSQEDSSDAEDKESLEGSEPPCDENQVTKFEKHMTKVTKEAATTTDHQKMIIIDDEKFKHDHCVFLDDCPPSEDYKQIFSEIFAVLRKAQIDSSSDGHERKNNQQTISRKHEESFESDHVDATLSGGPCHNGQGAAGTAPETFDAKTTSPSDEEEWKVSSRRRGSQHAAKTRGLSASGHQSQEKVACSAGPKLKPAPASQAAQEQAKPVRHSKPVGQKPSDQAMAVKKAGEAIGANEMKMDPNEFPALPTPKIAKQKKSCAKAGTYAAALRKGMPESG